MAVIKTLMLGGLVMNYKIRRDFLTLMISLGLVPEIKVLLECCPNN